MQRTSRKMRSLTGDLRPGQDRSARGRFARGRFAHARRAAVVALAALLGTTGVITAPQQAGAETAPRHGAPGFCPPAAAALSFSDALDKVDYDGIRVGGLSDIAWDRRSHSYVSSVDNHAVDGQAPDPSRLWFYRDLAHPRIWRDPLVLTEPDGTPYNGKTADNEGLAVLPDGRFLVSSETEPSIRIFGRNGRQQSQLPIPSRFQVSPAGEATANATLEGLTVSRDGKTVVASMEGTLSGDTPAAGQPADFRRLLVYTKHHHSYRLTKQVGYTVDDGQRIAEVQSYANGKLLILEASYDPAVGNTIKLYATTGLNRAPDVTAIQNLSATPGKVLKKTLVADVTACPTLGATAKQPQANPLMDNYEGMITKPLSGRYGSHRHGAGRQLYGVTLISDDNFGATQITRVLNLVALLP